MWKKWSKWKILSISSLLLVLLNVCDIMFHCITTEILHWKQNWSFGFLGSPSQFLTSCCISGWPTHRCVAIVQLSLFNSGYTLLRGQMSFPSFPSCHLPSKHPTSQRTAQTVQSAENIFNWLNRDRRKTNADIKEEASGTEKAFQWLLH